MTRQSNLKSKRTKVNVTRNENNSESVTVADISILRIRKYFPTISIYYSTAQHWQYYPLSTPVDNAEPSASVDWRTADVDNRRRRLFVCNCSSYIAELFHEDIDTSARRAWVGLLGQRHRVSGVRRAVAATSRNRTLVLLTTRAAEFITRCNSVVTFGDTAKWANTALQSTREVTNAWTNVAVDSASNDCRIRRICLRWKKQP